VNHQNEFRREFGVQQGVVLHSSLIDHIFMDLMNQWMGMQNLPKAYNDFFSTLF